MRTKLQCVSMLHYGMVTCYWKELEEQCESLMYEPDGARADPEARIVDPARQSPYVTEGPKFLTRYIHEALYQSYEQSRVSAYLTMLEQGWLSGYRALSAAPSITTGSELDYVIEYWLARSPAFNVLDAAEDAYFERTTTQMKAVFFYVLGAD